MHYYVRSSICLHLYVHVICFMGLFVYDIRVGVITIFSKLINPTSPLGVGGLRWCIIPKGRDYPPPYPAREDPPITTEHHEKSCLQVSCSL